MRKNMTHRWGLIAVLVLLSSWGMVAQAGPGCASCAAAAKEAALGAKGDEAKAAVAAAPEGAAVEKAAEGVGKIGTVETVQAEVGKPAPDFSLVGLDGTEVRLSAYKGKFVVLEWFNVDCPFVVKHYGSGNMQGLQKSYTEKDVVWLSICSSAPGKQGYFPAEELKKKSEEQGFHSTAILHDPTGVVGKLYDAKTTPHLFVIDKEGVLQYAGAIDSIRSTDKADIEKADNHVRAALDALMEGKPVETVSTQPYGCSVKY